MGPIENPTPGFDRCKWGRVAHPYTCREGRTAGFTIAGVIHTAISESLSPETMLGTALSVIDSCEVAGKTGALNPRLRVLLLDAGWLPVGRCRSNGGFSVAFWCWRRSVDVAQRSVPKGALVSPAGSGH
ncbi:hypothetical protein KRMM14A1259_03530 [Krasilnikovia sp. MM14-A1259]